MCPPKRVKEDDKKEKKHLQKVSRLLAQVLRHTPKKLDLTLDSQEWVAVDVLLTALADHDLPISQGQLVEIVQTNDKKRFSLSDKRRMANITAEQALVAETAGLDIRFPAGAIDAPELPSSYKNAANVVRQINSFGLAEIVDYIDPYDCMMAGDIPPF
ncbi:MAG: RNA 2'-phosphotransferase [Tateyamaria sp.]|uniref:RNA 2'-phosphotransferase n=1 Tax=Tateyamaria sp. TaxID=1929288 RepID=UPI00329DD920